MVSSRSLFRPRTSGWQFAAATATLWLFAMSPGRAGVVEDWNATTQAAILATPGAQPAVFYPLVHVAIYDAVNAIDGQYSVFAVSPTGRTRGASREAAAAAAAYAVLLNEFPAQKPMLDSALATSLAAVPNGSPKTMGVAIGQEVATAWMAARVGDGRTAVVPYAFTSEPGDYQLTPPGPPVPAAPFVTRLKPYAMDRPSQFRAYGPPDLTSVRYAADLNLTRTLGALDSPGRTSRQSETALFHTESPATFWARNMRDLAAARDLSTSQSARFFAMTFVGLGDATIACWDSKYYFNRWRPVTAIRAADTDDNPATVVDTAWTPFANTPPHPEYPAAHGCVGGAIADLIEEFFGRSRMRVTMTSTVPGTVPHVYQDTDAIVEEIVWARVYGGMHFLTSGRHGADIGRKVARLIERDYFQPVRRH